MKFLGLITFFISYHFSVARLDFKEVIFLLVTNLLKYHFS